MNKWLTWLDDNILLVISGFLLAFIPLFPKIPLFSPIESYIVRVRLEDIFVLVAALIWFIQLLRRKVTLSTRLVYFIVAYAVVGLLSTLSAIFITKTIPMEPLHLGKSFLHYFRYLEYFTLFFIAYSSVKKAKDLYVLLGVMVVTLLSVSIYGFGQKYLYWPLYSTMNREFSKGVRLYLTEHARVQSTFAGHYDLAAYLVITLNMVLAWFYVSERKLYKWLFGLSFLLGTVLIILSASRTSFAAFIIGISLVTAMIAFRQKTWQQTWWWGSTRLVTLAFLILVLISQFGKDMWERFVQVLEISPPVYAAYQTGTKRYEETVEQVALYLKNWNVDVEKIAPEIEKPKDGIAIDNTQDYGNVLVPSDERPVPTKPSDVYVDVPDIVKVSTKSATGEDIIIEEERDRVFSECAVKRGLSLCIRLETLWPRAIKGFQTNPLLGSGYATLNKETVYQFTEAESTDNNFLRTLGETGFLGFITFYGTIAIALYFAIKLLQENTAVSWALSTGFIGATIGLLINAIYIDVFAASKVAFTYWTVTGILIGYYLTLHQDSLAPADHVKLPVRKTKKRRKSSV